MTFDDFSKFQHFPWLFQKILFFQVSQVFQTLWEPCCNDFVAGYHSKKMSIDASLCIDVFTTEEFFGCRNLRALVRASRTIWWNWNGTEHNNKHENMIWYVIIWCHKINYPDSKVHGAYMGHTWGRQVRPRWAPCWPHEPCYQGSFVCVPQTTNPIN